MGELLYEALTYEIIGAAQDVIFERKFRTDLFVEDKVLIENKAIKKITNQDEAQLINYLKTTRMKVGLLFNFEGAKFEFLRRIF